MRLYNSLTQCNNSTMRKVLQADMQLSSRSPECWSSHDLSAMEGLTQSYMFKQKLLNCEPIDLSRFVVDLRGRHLEFWTPFSDGHPREAQQRNAYLSPVMRAACTKSSGHPSSLLASPHTCFLTFHEMWFAAWLVSDCVFTPFALKQQLKISLFHLFPYLQLVWGWWWCPGWKACSLSLQAPQMVSLCRSVRSYSYKQEYAFLQRMCLLFHTRKTTNSFVHS